MSTPDTLELMYVKAKSGDERSVDEFFHEVLELISLVQGINISHLVDKVFWFKTNAHISRKGFAYAMLTKGFVDSFFSRHGSSIEFSTEASTIFSELGYADGVSICSLIIGTNYRGFGNTDLAIQYITAAFIQLHETDNNLHFTVASGSQLAELYMETGNYPASLALCKELLPLVHTPANKKKMFDARLLNTTGNVYAKLGDYERALEYLHHALEQSEELNQLPVTARVLTDIGGFHQSLRNYDLAIQYNEQALAIREQLNLRNPMITNVLNIANIYALQNKTGNAIEMLKAGAAIAEELMVKPRMLQILKKLSGLYEETGDLLTSLAYYKRYHTILEEQNNELQAQKMKNIKLVVEAEQAVKQNEIIKAQKEEIEREKKRSDALLLNILPAEVAEELKNNDTAEARYFSDVTVLFTDFVDFTTTAERLTPKELVSELHACFKAFDDIMGAYDIEKIKTIGDAYMAVCGLPAENPDHAQNVVRAAIEILEFMRHRKELLGDMTFDIRIGINSGSVVAGIVGVKKFAYDIWGDTVNTAARMEQSSDAGRINISETTHELVKDQFAFEYRGEILAKGKGMLKMYYLSI